MAAAWAGVFPEAAWAEVAGGEDSAAGGRGAEVEAAAASTTAMQMCYPSAAAASPRAPGRASCGCWSSTRPGAAFITLAAS